MKISKYSFGIGDRFAHEGVNQLKALIEAEKRFGVHFTRSGTSPTASTR